MLDRSRYGIDRNGILRSVDEVERGLQCGLVCTKCRQPLKARKGARRIHHLSHHRPNVNCSGSTESALHLLAKSALAESTAIRLPDLNLYIDGLEPRLMAYVPVPSDGEWEFESFRFEVPRGDLRIDAVGTMAGGEIGIEIKVTHQVDERKAETLSALGVSCFEIDLSDLCRWDVDKEEVLTAVRSTAQRKWIVEPVALFASEYSEALVEAERFKSYLRTIRSSPRTSLLSAGPDRLSPEGFSPTVKIDEQAWRLARERLGIPDPPPPPSGLTQDQVEAVRVYFPNWLQDKYP